MKRDEILTLAANGWEIASSGGIVARYWIQQGGARSGGPSVLLRWNQVHLLESKGLIEKAPKTETEPLWLTRYRLVNKD